MKKKVKTILALFAGLLTCGAASKSTTLSGTASFYGKEYIGRLMANGQPYNPRAFTLACNNVPLGTVLYVEYRRADGIVRSAHATVTDRGPAERLRQQGRIFDLSYALFCHLADPRHGVIPITARIVP